MPLPLVGIAAAVARLAAAGARASLRAGRFASRLGGGDEIRIPDLGRALNLRVELKGMPEALAALEQFSARRLNAMLATALTRTAVGMRDDLRAEAQRVFDAPRPYTLGAIVSRGASAANLQARVEVRPDSPAATYLLPQVQGGRRPQKRFEQLAGAFGLPAGWVVVPAAGARLDRFGNVERRQLKEIFGALQRPHARVAVRRARRAQPLAYFVLKPGATNAAPGVYARTGGARAIVPVLLFVRSATYVGRWRFDAVARDAALRRWPVELERATRDAVARWQRTR